jgi:hypothetical protein
MRDRAANPKRHLTPDEVEIFALGLPARPRGARAHLGGCSECNREVESLRALDEALSGLADLAPSPRFAEQVMARVSLRAPWYSRAWAVTRDHWAPLAAAGLALAATTSLMVLWLGNQPELSVMGLSGLVLQQIRDFSLQVVMAVGGLLWSSSLIRSVIEAAERIGMEGAILLLSALSLVTISAAGAMMRLMQPAPLRLRSSA